MDENKHLLTALKREYRILQFLCYISWSANVIFMIFGVVYLYDLGISLSGIFLLNIIVIVVSTITSMIINNKSDKIKKRKVFMVFSYALRTIGIFLLAIGNSIILFIAYYIISSLLNPLSFDVSMIYEIGEKISILENRVNSKPLQKNASTRYYLKYRMFGSLGWALMAPLAGFSILQLNSLNIEIPFLFPNLFGYRFFLYLAGFIYLFTTVIFSRIYKENMYERVNISLPDSKGYFKDKKTQFNSKIRGNKALIAPSLLLLLISMFLFQAGASLFQTPYGIFMKEFSSGNLFLVGISYFFSAILEMPLFLLAYKIINLKNYQTCLFISFLLEITRVSLTIMVIPVGMAILVLPLQMMNSFSLRWPSLAHGLVIEAPKRKASTVNLNLVLQKAGTFFGSILGSIISSLVVGIASFSYLFTLSLVFLFATIMLFGLGHFFLQRKIKKQNASTILSNDSK